ncbi:restriction endonuclease subunit S [Methanosarcina vacuolata]|uniref:Type I restriction-modification system, specificity subunit S n=1 Tax=Methanosarcina vacuolata Z-761 TaxID=1434123 RepID=A0A0E3Q7T5_9EURY|nr:restriction endonuclease subunit S [Methanosarcina vacuolata]AKB45025.1 Type I restriction-modification system, specificity subunit S [Methanosarcina vacuolata Z-761]
MIHALKPYPAYKDSGIPWIGDVPEHWKQLPGRACFTEKKVPNIGLLEKTVLSLSYGQIVIKPPEKLHGLVPESFETYQIIEPNDIIIRSTDLQNDQNSLRFGFAKTKGIITSAYMCFQTQKLLIPEYGHLLLHTYDLMKIFYGRGSGLRQNLDWRDFKYLPCPVPPLSEQSAIVRYLDHIDRRIRHYILAKKKLIKLLEEQKQAIIHQAVTRGLDPNVKLKPSGIEWLGEIPEHWEVKPAKWYYREVDERSSTGSEELLSVSHITGVTPRSEKNITMFMAESYVGHKLCREGDLVINTMWAWMAALGIARQTGIVSPSYAVYRPIQKDAFLPQFIDLLLRIKPYVAEYVCRSTGIRSSRLRLYPEQFLSIPIIRPPIVEQQAILDKIYNATSELEHAIHAYNQGISLLREYRTRLIADVVTGKLDVREAAANLPEETDETEVLEDEFAGDEETAEEELESEPEEE